MRKYHDETLLELYEEIDPNWGERDFVDYARSYMDKKTNKILAIGGLRGTGKTTGLLQAVRELDAYYIIAQQGEEERGEDYIALLKTITKKYIIIDEYSWIHDRDVLDKYLYTAVQNGKRIAITGTESITLDLLNYGNLIHRVDMVHCTLFTYDEYLRLNNLPRNKASCINYLRYGGTFDDYMITNYATARDYIKTAIIDNLVGYSKKLDVPKASAIVYSILYKAVCPDNLTNVPVMNREHLPINDFLSYFEVDPDIKFSPKELQDVANLFVQIGVLVQVPNLENDLSLAQTRYYIVNPAITYQLILAAYDIPEVGNDMLGMIYEASGMSHLAYHRLSSDKLYYLEIDNNKGNNSELDAVISQGNGKQVYLFEFKLKEDATLEPSATILSDVIGKFFPDNDMMQRIVIYNGDEKLLPFTSSAQKTHLVLFTSLQNACENYYHFDLESMKQNAEMMNGFLGRLRKTDIAQNLKKSRVDDFHCSVEGSSFAINVDFLEGKMTIFLEDKEINPGELYAFDPQSYFVYKKVKETLTDYLREHKSLLFKRYFELTKDTVPKKE